MMLNKLRAFFASYTLSNWVFFLLHIEAIFAAGLVYYPYISSLSISIMCLIGLIPQAGTIAYITEWICAKSNPIFAGVLYAIFGNFPELIFGLFSISNHEYEFLLAICFGSVLSNTLLALGLSIIVGHLKNPQKNIDKYHSLHRSGGKALFFATGAYLLSYFNTATRCTYSSHVDTIIANITPADPIMSASASYDTATYTGDVIVSQSIDMVCHPSRHLDIIISVVLILIYFYNNIYTFRIAKQIESGVTDGKYHTTTGVNKTQYYSPLVSLKNRLPRFRLGKKEAASLVVDADAEAGSELTVYAQDLSKIVIDNDLQDVEDGIEIIDGESSMYNKIFNHLKIVHSWFWIVVILCYSTVISALITDGITRQVKDLSVGWGLSPRFIGGILVSIVGNACEHWSTLIAAYRGEIDVALQISISSALQVLMFLIPMFVIGTSQISDFLYMGSDPIYMGALFITSVLVPLTLIPNLLDMYGGLNLVALYLMIAALFYVN